MGTYNWNRSVVFKESTLYSQAEMQFSHDFQKPATFILCSEIYNYILFNFNNVLTFCVCVCKHLLFFLQISTTYFSHLSYRMYKDPIHKVFSSSRELPLDNNNNVFSLSITPNIYYVSSISLTPKLSNIDWTCSELLHNLIITQYNKP